jgi:hypothetical protein
MVRIVCPSVAAPGSACPRLTNPPARAAQANTPGSTGYWQAYPCVASSTVACVRPISLARTAAGTAWASITSQPCLLATGRQRRNSRARSSATELAGIALPSGRAYAPAPGGPA